MSSEIRGLSCLCLKAHSISISALPKWWREVLRKRDVSPPRRESWQRRRFNDSTRIERGGTLPMKRPTLPKRRSLRILLASIVFVAGHHGLTSAEDVSEIAFVGSL